MRVKGTLREFVEVSQPLFKTRCFVKCARYGIHTAFTGKPEAIRFLVQIDQSMYKPDYCLLNPNRLLTPYFSLISCTPDALVNGSGEVT